MSTIDELAKDQPYWLQALLRDGPEANPLLSVDASLVAFVDRVRNNPEKFPRDTFDAIISGFGVIPENYSSPQRMLGPAVPRTAASTAEQTAEQNPPVATQTFEPDVETTTSTSSNMLGGLTDPFVEDVRDDETREQFANIIDRAVNPTEEVRYNAAIAERRERAVEEAGDELLLDYDAVASEYQALNSVEEIRKIWIDPGSAEFQNIPSMAAYLATQANAWEEFTGTVRGKEYLKQNPDLPTSLTFTPDVQGLLPDLKFGNENFGSFGKTEYTWNELVNIFDAPFFEPEHIARLNDTLSAAGFYDGQNQPPLNWSSKDDYNFKIAWMKVNTEAAAVGQQLPEFIRGKLAGRVDMLDKAFAQFDETNLASNMDTLALTLLGRKLTSSEYEELKSTIELFAKPREELLEGGDPIGDLENLESAQLDAATQTKLTNAFNTRFGSEVQRNRRRINAEGVMGAFARAAQRKPLLADTRVDVPDVVAESEGAMQ